jgi:serine/threonine protein kinase
VLGFAHSKGIVHCNVEPAHVLVRPRDHNVFLIDWSYAAVDPARTSEGFRTLNEAYSPPEAGERKPPSPASDLFSLGKTMVELLGGNVETNAVPPVVPDRLKRFLDFLLLPSPRMRAQDAWEMYQELSLLRQEVYGPKRFIELIV